VPECSVVTRPGDEVTVGLYLYYLVRLPGSKTFLVFGGVNLELMPHFSPYSEFSSPFLLETVVLWLVRQMRNSGKFVLFPAGIECGMI